MMTATGWQHGRTKKQRNNNNGNDGGAEKYRRCLLKSRDMDEETFLKHKPYAGTAKPSMMRRRIGHDYASRCVYLVTMTTEGRRPLLGTLVGRADAPAGSADAPHVVLTPLGERVRQAWMNNETYYPGVRVLATMVMPDHLHGILFFQEAGKVDLGKVIRGFKAGCNKAYREIMGLPRGGSIEGQGLPRGGSIEGQGLPRGGSMEGRGRTVGYDDTTCHQSAGGGEKRDREHGMLWAPEYNDHILEGAGELERWRNYLRDNPRRLAVRREHPEFFRVTFNLTVAGRTYSAIGNRFLLDYPRKMEVQCSRRLTKEEIETAVKEKLALARQGVVLVSPRITEGEKAVMDAALEARLPLVFLSPRGFNEYSRPGHRYYEACAEGRFLILAPWPHQNRETPLTRQMCLELNAMAREICGE